MKSQKYNRILYFIVTAIVLTLALQAYWLYRSFQAEQRELIADVQVSLNKAVDDYFTQLAQRQSMAFISDSFDIHGDSIKITIDSFPERMRRRWDFMERMDTIDGTSFQHFEFVDSSNVQNITAISIIDSLPPRRPPRRFRDSIRKMFKRLGRKPFELLTNKIVISFAEERMSLPQLDSIFHDELHERELWIDYGMSFDSAWEPKQTYGDLQEEDAKQTLEASSNFLLSDTSLKLHFKNTTPLILHRNGISLILSLLFVACIIGCLLYLLKIIREQKQLAEIKNDLISNITHEFKTPLATIGVALEGIQNFNAANDPEKSKKYAAMSQEQVKKLSAMVEKLLETATLDSNALALNKEEIDLVGLGNRLAVIPEAYIASNKSIKVHTHETELLVQADAFHLENAVNTLLDNAFKYGGDKITVGIDKSDKGAILTVHDNGNTLTKAQTQRIFEKFYRVPKGDTHDVKGFGIGLYYAKNIVEKHGGSLNVDLKKGTTFTLVLPYE